MSLSRGLLPARFLVRSDVSRVDRSPLWQNASIVFWHRIIGNCTYDDDSVFEFLLSTVCKAIQNTATRMLVSRRKLLMPSRCWKPRRSGQKPLQMIWARMRHACCYL